MSFIFITTLYPLYPLYPFTVFIFLSQTRIVTVALNIKLYPLSKCLNNPKRGLTVVGDELCKTTDFFFIHQIRIFAHGEVTGEWMAVLIPKGELRGPHFSILRIILFPSFSAHFFMIVGFCIPRLFSLRSQRSRSPPRVAAAAVGCQGAHA